MENEMNEKNDSTQLSNDERHAWSFESAEGFLRAGALTDEERAQGKDGESARQTRLLREWALQARRLIGPDFFKNFDLVSDRTSEHKVYFDPASSRAVKHTHPGEFGWTPVLVNDRWTLAIAQPLDYLRRWMIFNEIFDDDVRLEGVGTFGVSLVIGSKVEPLSIVISQPWRTALEVNHPLPSQMEIEECLRAEGFEPLLNSFYGWQRAEDGIVLLDARPDNFIKTRDGVAPIDLPLMRRA